MKFRYYLWILMFVLVYCLMETSKVGGEKIVFCNVGQGDAILIKSEGRKILFDTGPKNGKIYSCLLKHMPFWDRTIDIFMVSHNDFDHNANEEDIKKNYKIKKFINGENIKSGDEIVFGKNKMLVLNNKGESKNEGSLVVDLTLNKRKILLTGDIDVDTENRLIWRKIIKEKYDILKVAHHGSNTSSSEDFLRIVRPRVSVISVGKNNYGHPDRELIKRLNNIKTKIFRTDEMGDIEFTF